MRAKEHIGIQIEENKINYVKVGFSITQKHRIQTTTRTRVGLNVYKYV